MNKMSYTGYQTALNETYSSYNQQYDSSHYNNEPQTGQYPLSSSGQYDYGYSTDPYSQSSAPPSVTYTPYVTTTQPTSYPPFSYNQEVEKVEQPPQVSAPYNSSMGGFQIEPSNYLENPPQQNNLTTTEFTQYPYQRSDYAQPPRSFQNPPTQTEPYSNRYDYQETSYKPPGWNREDQFNDPSYSSGAYFEGVTKDADYGQKRKGSYENREFIPSDSYSKVNDSYLQNNTYSGNGLLNIEFQQPDVVPLNRHQEYPDYTGSVNSKFTPMSDRVGRNFEQNYTPGRGGSFNNLKYQRRNISGNMQDILHDDINIGNMRNNQYCDEGNGPDNVVYSTPIPQNMGNFRNSGSHIHSKRGARGQSGRMTSSRGLGKHQNTNKKVFDARNRLNEVRSLAAVAGKTNNKQTKNKNTPKVKQEVFKTPSRPQDRLLNEIAEKELAKNQGKVKAEEKLKISEVEKNKISALEQFKNEEEMRKKLADEAVKAAPPSKPPETPEEIAREEEIQRKIRESVVIIKPEQEIALLKDDPSRDVEMPEELRVLLKTLTTDYLCKLCSVRIVGPHMAAMHYNGKNHLKKLRNFVQTNGRSAGFNMETIEQTDDSNKETSKGAESKKEIVEITDIDENKYCKVCKVSFSQDSQAEMHYKGKNHAKKLRNIGASNGPDVFECKICCVTVTAQEHLTAHLNGARHKLQVRKLDSNENFRGNFRGRGRGGLGSWTKGKRPKTEENESGGWKQPLEPPQRGRGMRGRAHFRGGNRGRGLSEGFKQQGAPIDGGLQFPEFDGPSFNKRRRF
ncbi:uncharacterized protein LOC131949331 isoform X2 [Physella acuta]|uniref:uncharacterized protein LOC131949331 isoform X2 n=1 Tax=Physella acuta TaxID=109671 RepID=UPI0027DE7574|nr:uncharacterized protein LOC131949331 isoform X2 [Physella acuta]